MTRSLASLLAVVVSAAAAGCGNIALAPDGGGKGGASGAGGGSTGGSGGGGSGSGGSGGSVDGGGGTCVYLGAVYPVGAGFPSGDGCNQCSCAAPGEIACTTRACAVDAGSSSDAVKGCALDTTYTYGDTGGLTAFEIHAKLSPPASYAYARTPVAGTASVACAPALPPCNAADALDVSDILRDLADSDVQHALSAASPPLYGHDDRPSDGSVFSFQRADGHGFLVGTACGTASDPSCVAVPAGVARFVAELRALDQQQLKDPSCAALR